MGLPKWRVFSPHQNNVVGDTIELSADDSHHIKDVVRLTKGDKLLVICREQRQQFLGTIKAVDKFVKVTLDALTEVKSDPISVATVGFALSKGERNDIVCQKCTELNVNNLVFWESERSVVKLDGPDLERKRMRFERIALEATKQCGRIEVPSVALKKGVAETISHIRSIAGPNDRFLFCSLSEGAQPLKNMLPLNTPVHLIIGPEGDLTSEEEKSFVRHGFEGITLGNLVLRSETAAIVAVAMVQAMFTLPFFEGVK